jgi:phage tail-like protein
MANKDLLTSFYFSVAFDQEGSAVDAAFQEVIGLSKEMGVEEVVSGGENRFKYRLPSQVSYPNLVLKRGIVLLDSPLIEWCQSTLDGGFRNPVQTKKIFVNLLDPDGHVCMGWRVLGAYPLKWSMSELKSQESNVLIETIEFAYRYFEADDSRNNAYAGVDAMFAGA